ncbi:MAG TPA: hypothetical protein PLC15_06150, partial [Candidatus Obscuribacter sp.]|nr:hypothetical protein [Candidatus Obscuribacter sp.]
CAGFGDALAALVTGLIMRGLVRCSARTTLPPSQQANHDSDDEDDVKRYCNEIAKEMQKGSLPKINFILVGVGEGVNEEQMEEICHEEYPGIGHLWCHRIAEEINEVAELVAVLVDESMTVAGGGRIVDDKGKVLKLYESRLPAVLEFQIPEGAKSFTLEINGQRYTQPIPEDDDDDDDDHH